MTHILGGSASLSHHHLSNSDHKFCFLWVVMIVSVLLARGQSVVTEPIVSLGLPLLSVSDNKEIFCQFIISV